MFNINICLLITADDPVTGDIFVLTDENNQVPTEAAAHLDNFNTIANKLYTKTTMYSHTWGKLRFKTFTQTNENTVNMYYHGYLSLDDRIKQHKWTNFRELITQGIPLEGLR